MYQKVKEEVLKQIGLSEYREAFQVLKTVLQYPSKIETEEIWKDAFSLFEEISSGLGEEKLSVLASNVVDEPSNQNTLFNFAFELYEHQLHSIAATVLAKANEIQPNSAKIVTELVTNLEVMMLHEEAIKVLTNSQELLNTSDFCYYLLGFNNLMLGKIDMLNKIFARLQGNDDPDIQFMANFLDTVLERVLILRTLRQLDITDLRGWHMVLNGSFLLHYSPHGIETMHGRYAYVADSYSVQKEGIEKVKVLLQQSEIEVPYVFHLPSRSSKILALATSQMFNIPLDEWKEENYTKSGLIVAYDCNEIGNQEIFKSLKSHRANQVLWIHASLWTKQVPIVGDITTFLYQHNVAPWGQRMIYDPETKQVEESQPDDLPEVGDIPENSESAIDELSLADLDNLLSMVDILKAMKSGASPGLFRNNGLRLIQRLGSPVRSNRF